MSIHPTHMTAAPRHRLTDVERDALRLACGALLLGLATLAVEVALLNVDIRGYSDTLLAIYAGLGTMIAFSLILPHRTSLFLTMAAVPFSLLIVYLLAYAVVPLHLPAFLLLIAAVIVAGREEPAGPRAHATGVR